jgi:hypothetical protein
MIGFAKIVGGSPSSVAALGKHLLTHTLPADQANVAAYYHRGMKSGVDDVYSIGPDGVRGEPTAVVRPDMHPLVAKGLGISLDKPLGLDGVNALLAGRQANGKQIEGKIYAKERAGRVNPKTGEKTLSTPIGSYDFCPSPHKSVSVAWAFASDAERALIFDAAKSAAREATSYIAQRIGVAHSENAGEVSFVSGHVGWLEFTHFTARRTKIGFNDAGDLTLTKDEVAGDPDVHFHTLIPNAVFCENGKVGSLHTGMIQGFIFEADAYFQSRLADNLLKAGFDVVLDDETKAAKFQAIPDLMNKVFSKRSAAGELIAKQEAKEKGKDWDLMPPEERTAWVRRAAHDYEQQRAKGGKDDVANFASWREQAERFGWKPPETFMRQTHRPELTDEQRIRIGYENALPMLEELLGRKSVITQHDIRSIAGRGLIPVGAKSVTDINAVTQMMREEGVMQQGKKTALVWGHEQGARHVSVTTELHETQEKRFIELAKSLADDKSAAIPEAVLNRAIDQSGLRFDGEHGKSQLAMISRLGSGGRYAVAIAAAGAGKTAALKPIVAAKKELGWNLYGASPAWRQADDLVDAGIDQKNIRAYSVLIDELSSGKLRLGSKDLVAVDEISLLGTAPGLRLLEHANAMGFQVIALGDPIQCAALEAGSIIDLTKKALPGQVPEIITTIRQQTEREQKIVSLLREGRAKEALDMKRSDGTAEMVPGDYDKVTARVAKLYMERLKETGQAPTVSAPTNHDAHRVSIEIRKERRAAGLIGDDLKVIKAGDNEGRHYGLALAPGDKIRLFKSTGARFANGNGGNIGRNGSVLEIQNVTNDGIIAKSVKTGRVGFVGWEALTAKHGPSQGRVLLAYADCTTIHSSQGSTSHEHILALPGGSKAINGLQGYSGGTRHRNRLWLLTSDVAERLEITKRRALNDPRQIDIDDKWANVARNLSKQPVAELAVSMLERVERIRRGTTQRFQSAMHIIESSSRQISADFMTKVKGAVEAYQAKEHADEVVQDTPAVEPAQIRALPPDVQAINHVSDWLSGRTEPDLRRLADYVNMPDARLSSTEVYDKLTGNLERAIRERELRDAGQVIGLTPEQRKLHGFPEQAPLPKYLRQMSAQELNQRLEKIKETWWDLDAEASYRSDVAASKLEPKPPTPLTHEQREVAWAKTEPIQRSDVLRQAATADRLQKHTIQRI